MRVDRAERRGKRTRSPGEIFTRLQALITQEKGAFIVSVRLLNHLNLKERALGQEIATSIEVASSMIDSIAEEFCISQNSISIAIEMENIKDGTFH